MIKFKVGDKVKLKSGLCCINLNHIDIYTVRKSQANSVALVGMEYYYAEHVFMLYEEGKNKELEVLTPLQVVEAILEGSDIQMEYAEVGWKDVDTKALTVNFIAMNIFRHKPKTIVINGIEVPAPLSKKPNQEFIYFINLFKSRVYQLPTEKLTFNHNYFWATQEDAQKVLDAMLIPFNNFSESNKGEK